MSGLQVRLRLLGGRDFEETFEFEVHAENPVRTAFEILDSILAEANVRHAQKSVKAATEKLMKERGLEVPKPVKRRKRGNAKVQA